MRTLFIVLMLFVMICSCSPSKTVIELKPQQSMLITGKGEGQDGAINPYRNQPSIAEVRNLGNTTFSVRIENNDVLLRTVELDGHESREFDLNVGDELYFDSISNTRVAISFKKSE